MALVGIFMVFAIQLLMNISWLLNRNPWVIFGSYAFPNGAGSYVGERCVVIFADSELFSEAEKEALFWAEELTNLEQDIKVG